MTTRQPASWRCRSANADDLADDALLQQQRSRFALNAVAAAAIDVVVSGVMIRISDGEDGSAQLRSAT